MTDDAWAQHMQEQARRFEEEKEAQEEFDKWAYPRPEDRWRHQDKHMQLVEKSFKEIFNGDV